MELPPKGNGKKALEKKKGKKDRFRFTFRVFSKCLHLFDVEESFVYQRIKDDLKTDFTYDYPSFLPLKQTYFDHQRLNIIYLMSLKDIGLI